MSVIAVSDNRPIIVVEDATPNIDITMQGPVGPEGFGVEYHLDAFVSNHLSTTNVQLGFETILADSNASLTNSDTGYYADGEGGLIVLGFHPYHIGNYQITLPRYLRMRGQGAGLSVIVCEHANSRVNIGETTLSQKHHNNLSGGFTIDGAGIATLPLWIGRVVQGVFQDITVANSAGAGIEIAETQNSRFLGLESVSHAGDAIQLTNGAAGNHLWVECSGFGGYGIAGYASTTGGGPSNNTFYGIVENPQATVNSMVYFEAGTGNLLDRMSISDATPDHVVTLIKTVVNPHGGAPPDYLTLRDVSLQGGNYGTTISSSVTTTVAGDATHNEQQVVDVTGAASGTYTLTFTRISTQTTSAIAYSATAATVQAALEALSNIGSGNVSVTGGRILGTSTYEFTIVFQGALALLDVPQLTVTTTSLVARTAYSTIGIDHGGSFGSIYVEGYLRLFALGQGFICQDNHCTININGYLDISSPGAGGGAFTQFTNNDGGTPSGMDNMILNAQHKLLRINRTTTTGGQNGFFQGLVVGENVPRVSMDTGGITISKDGSTTADRLSQGAAGQLTTSGTLKATTGLLAGTGLSVPGTITVILTHAISWTPGTLANGASALTGITITGAALGDHALPSFDALTDVGGWVLAATITATNQGRVRLTNNTGSSVTLGAGNLRVTVFRVTG
jgi:hypothetical protein